jgi:hypothetical protein
MSMLATISPKAAGEAQRNTPCRDHGSRAGQPQPLPSRLVLVVFHMNPGEIQQMGRRGSYFVFEHPGLDPSCVFNLAATLLPRTRPPIINPEARCWFWPNPPIKTRPAGVTMIKM